MKSNRVFGDANFADYFGLALAKAGSGAAVEECLAAIHPEDRERVAAAIRHSVIYGGAFYQVYRVQSIEKRTRIVAATGHCYLGEDGGPAIYPGWFSDVTGISNGKPGRAQLAGRYLTLAREVLRSPDDDFLLYLLDNLIEEIEAAGRGGGPTPSNFVRSR